MEAQLVHNNLYTAYCKHKEVVETSPDRNHSITSNRWHKNWVSLPHVCLFSNALPNYIL